ncbi:exodeoxyribonuclease III [Dehalococcoidia bacterium]|nr:exodeoxyribonuclease III [Dehalococcoidia bacterium]MCL0070641.1 exodeoxyribonuclease III [Dehalococcoidia bacterium]MCL0092332.1 exodeoxyribonuclease III [Dehalococcoidia bacterium]
MRELNQRYGTETRNISLFSWNVNGIRAAHRKGFVVWLANTVPDILCLQETRARVSQLNSDLARPTGYYAYWNSAATRAGYSGTALLSRDKPLSVEFGLGDVRFDQEGRTIIAEYPDFTLVNCYFPNGNSSHSRLLFKLDFYEAFLAKCEELRSEGHTVVFCGDLNTAHKEIDLANPQSNRRKSGFLPEERRWIDRVIETGYVDTFRYLHPSLAEQYTWWSYRAHSRGRNVGWRFDYFFTVREAVERVTDAFIVSEVALCDHCPIGIRLQVNNRA